MASSIQSISHTSSRPDMPSHASTSNSTSTTSAPISHPISASSSMQSSPTSHFPSATSTNITTPTIPTLFPPPSPKPKRLHFNPFNIPPTIKAPLLVLLGEAFGSLMAATTRLLEMPTSTGTPGMHTLQILFVRFSITGLLCMSYMYWKGVEDAPLGKRDVRGWLVLRGCCGFCAIFSFYYSLQYLPLGEAIIISFITPLLTAYASSLFLSQPFSFLQLLSGLISFLGIIVVADPAGFSSSSSPSSSDDNNSVFGSKVTSFQRFSAIALGILSDFFAAGAFTTIRVIGTRTHTLISVNFYALVTILLSGIILLVPVDNTPSFRLPHGVREWFLLLGIGVFGFMLQFLMTAALVMDRSSRTTNMMYSQIVFAVALDWVVWGTVPSWTGWGGGAVVVGSVVWGCLLRDEVVAGGKDEEYAAVPMEDFEVGSESEEGDLDEGGDESKSDSHGARIEG